ncbi:class I SAM-dependent methyltransferase [Actinoplanes sp. KI2]|uniref:class I SAM-dependent methyltransferase n=1 Tax=Actinoplanes sp. KI2 TaxID=2983315 RepID=UPI0021D5DFAD|nr:class I SAM-dependent methyltransferase [Actinoplanes sp. KI2]MCU7722731.1 class I SAM-dependent methyltransferase [Actinoplanes sp. KI2]
MSSAPAFLAELRASVAEWCATVSSLSPASCSHGPVDAVSCAWYHGVWPFLREVDMVSSPTWHHDFYRTWLPRDPGGRVLVSGTADFSMVAYAIEAGGEVIVLDQCRTPLDASEWYARRAGVPLTARQGDLLRDDLPVTDATVIVSDALLTRFAPADAAIVAKKWFAALAPGGRVVTTVRIHSGSEFDATGEARGRARFAERFRQRLDGSAAHGKLGTADLVAAAGVYADKMTSANLGSEESIRRLFEAAGFTIVHEAIAVVPGEFAPTRYLRLVAERPA